MRTEHLPLINLYLLYFIHVIMKIFSSINDTVVTRHFIKFCTIVIKIVSNCIISMIR